MSDKTIYQGLQSIEIQNLRQVQRRLGRLDLPADFKLDWAEKHQYALDLLADRQHGKRVRLLASLLSECTYSLAVLEKNPVPTYYPYTDVHILDWFIGRTFEPFAELRVKAIEGIFYLLLDLLYFEAESLTGIQRNHRERLERKVLINRLETLEEAFDTFRELSNLILGLEIEKNVDIIRYETLGQYASEDSRVSALVHFSCFPQTRFHDEVVFLRTIHVSELCFFGIQVALWEAIENIRRERPEVAERCLSHATAYGKMLHKVFKVLKTMPPEHFADFRDATGHASAVQSKNYQLMEIHFRGIHPGKDEVFKRYPHLTFLKAYSHPEFLHLGRALRERSESELRWQGVFRAARALDRQLLTWRGLHLAFAKLYLPPEAGGTGGTTGVSYLERFHRAGLFPETEPDAGVLAQMFPDFKDLTGGFYVPPNPTIAPDERIRSSS